MTEFDTGSIAIAVIGGKLTFMMVRDPIARKVKSVERLFRTRCKGRFDFRGSNGETGALKIEAIILECQLGERGVAPRPHVCNYGADGVVDVRRHFALLSEQGRELALEITVVAAEPHRHNVSCPRSARNRTGFSLRPRDASATAWRSRPPRSP